MSKQRRDEKSVRRIERIFAHAAALSQNSQSKNTIYCLGRYVYVVNQDQTVLLRFHVPKSEAFSHPVSFRADDYESPDFQEKDGRIEFRTETDEYERVKSCGTPDRKPEDIQTLFKTILKNSNETDSWGEAVLSSEVIGLLEESLSHVEFSSRKGKLRLVQRNIYSGATVTVRPKTLKQRGGFAELDPNSKSGDFEPLGMRTNDFAALFLFTLSIRFTFKPNIVLVESSDLRVEMEGFVSQCVYDQLGEDPDGRKKSKERRS